MTRSYIVTLHTIATVTNTIATIVNLERLPPAFSITADAQQPVMITPPAQSEGGDHYINELATRRVDGIASRNNTIPLSSLFKPASNKRMLGRLVEAVLDSVKAEQHVAADSVKAEQHVAA